MHLSNLNILIDNYLSLIGEFLTHTLIHCTDRILGQKNGLDLSVSQRLEWEKSCMWLPVPVCFLSLFLPFLRHWLAGSPHSMETCVTPSTGQMAVSKAKGSSRNLPEQSAASRCRLIVSGSRGSVGHMPRVCTWVETNIFICTPLCQESVLLGCEK